MADREHVLSELSVYADPARMKLRYGIDITREQVRAARKTLEYYRKIDKATLDSLSDEMALRWPYRLTDAQRLDAMLHVDPPGFNIPQSIIWNELRPPLLEDAKKYPDVKAIVQAVKDIEGFIRFNAYLGDFEENRALVGNEDNKLMVLFAMAYSNHKTE